MNHDDNKPDLRSLIAPELEARVVAWVSGEASAFEAAELERLVGEEPELAIFKRRLEAVRGLVAEAMRPDPQPLVLAPERRAKLLQAFGAPEAGTVASVDQPIVAAKRKHRKSSAWMYAIAACLVAGFGAMMAIPAFVVVHKRPISNNEAVFARVEAPAVTVAVPTAEAMSQPANLDPQSMAVPADETQMPRQRADLYAKQLKLKKEEDRKRAVAFEVDQSRETKREFSLNNPVAPSAPAKVGNFAGTGDGYTAATTLAGIRLNTELRDVGNSVTVVTSQFMKDVAATNKEGPLNYSSGTEVGGGATYGKGNKSRVMGFPADTTSLPSAGVGLEANLDGAPAVAAALSVRRNDEEVLVLSPFEVTKSADSDRYEANVVANNASPLILDKFAWADAAKKPAEREGADDKPLPPPAEKPAQTTFPEVSAAKEPVSTFSLHVSDVSFRLAQQALANDSGIDPERLRAEEFYNAFDYGDPNPALAEKVSARIEQAAHPFLQQRNLVRIALKVANSGRDAAQPLRLTVLLDTSGSMEREDRVATVQHAMASLNSLLGPNDRLTLIGFARQPRLLAESLPGDQTAQVQELIAHTPAEGGTNLEEALKLGQELAQRQFEPTAQNRVVLLTDGAANLGNAQPAQLAAAIEALRQQGIAFDACGVGLEGLDDAMLETLTRKGDGRYYVLNSPEAAAANFAQQLAGAFRPAAENVKLQVRFNPNRVGHYRLIGFEKHRLNEEDFRNDQVDAAELAAEEAAVAVYQVEALPQGEGELGEVYVRFRDPASGNMVERSWPLNYDAQAPAFDRASPSMQLAGTSALFAEILRGGDEGKVAGELRDLAPYFNRLRNQYANQPRVQELVTMFEQARRQAGE